MNERFGVRDFLFEVKMISRDPLNKKMNREKHK